MRPGEVFRKSWILLNDGSMPWGDDEVQLVCLTETIEMLGSPRIPITAPHDRTTISVDLKCPERAGVYESKWIFSYRNKTFGPMIWCSIEVSPREQFEVLDVPLPDCFDLSKPFRQLANTPEPLINSRKSKIRGKPKVSVALFSRTRNEFDGFRLVFIDRIGSGADFATGSRRHAAVGACEVRFSRGKFLVTSSSVFQSAVAFRRRRRDEHFQRGETSGFNGQGDFQHAASDGRPADAFDRRRFRTFGTAATLFQRADGFARGNGFCRSREKSTFAERKSSRFDESDRTSFL